MPPTPLTRRVLFAHHRGQQSIRAQLVVVVEVLIPERQSKDPLAQKLVDRVLDQARFASIFEAAGKPLDNPATTVDIHALASRGGWDREVEWHPAPYVDTHAAELLFRQKVIRFLAADGLLDEGRIELLDTWKSGHTGFSAHNAVTVRAEDGDGVERLARYLARPSLSLERLRLEPGLARYRHKRATERRGEPFDPAELVGRLVMHVPAPRLHLVRYSAHYAHVARARRRRSGVQALNQGNVAFDAPWPDNGLSRT